MSGQVELTGAAVREETGSAEPARYSTREAVEERSARGADPTGVAVAMGRDPPGLCRNCSGGVGFGSDQRPRRFCRASASAAA